MKYILLPIHPEWVAKILNGEKTIEVRKTAPKCELPCEVFLYVTKGKDILIAYEDRDYDSMNYYDAEYVLIPKSLFAKKPSKDDEDYSLYESNRDAYNYYKNDFDKDQHDHEWKLNGKVVAKFTLNKVEKIKCYDIGFGVRYCVLNNDPRDYHLCEKTCLTQEELNAYLKEKVGYAWHIDNLVIFGKPKELKEFNKVGAPTYEQMKAILTNGYTKELHRKYLADLGYAVTKAPQSWCYVEVAE